MKKESGFTEKGIFDIRIGKNHTEDNEVEMLKTGDIF